MSPRLEDIYDAIDEVEAMPDTYSKAQKLATFYTLRDAVMKENDQYRAAPPVRQVENVIEYKSESDSEFAQRIDGLDPAVVWPVMDELMDTLQIINPRLYRGVLDKIK